MPFDLFGLVKKKKVFPQIENNYLRKNMETRVFQSETRAAQVLLGGDVTWRRVGVEAERLHDPIAGNRSSATLTECFL